MTARRPTRKAHGFTLLEMLVTLIIVTLITGLLWQAMQQVARIERLLQSAGSETQRTMVRREWVRELIASAQPELQGDIRSQFRGDATSVSLSSGAITDLPGFGTGPIRLSLIHEDLTGANTLKVSSDMVEVGDSSGGSNGVVLMRWVGPVGRFQYLDDKGEWQSQWPLARQAKAVELAYDPLLGKPPRMLRIDIGDEAGGVLLAVVGTTEGPRGRLVDWEKQ